MLAELVGRHLTRPEAAALMVRDMPAAEIASISEKLRARRKPAEYLSLIERADLRPGAMRLLLDQAALSESLGCAPEQINPAALAFEAPFQMSRRGVELKLHLGDPPAEIDRTLAQNIVQARRGRAMIMDGKTFSEIAEAGGPPSAVSRK